MAHEGPEDVSSSGNEESTKMGNTVNHLTVV
jgi:hypothetical protein